MDQHGHIILKGDYQDIIACPVASPGEGILISNNAADHFEKLMQFALCGKTNASFIFVVCTIVQIIEASDVVYIGACSSKRLMKYRDVAMSCKEYTLRPPG